MTDHSLSNTTAFDSQEEKEETVKSEGGIHIRQSATSILYALHLCGAGRVSIGEKRSSGTFVR